MALKNLGNNDYHIYEVNDNNISSISPDGTTSGCDTEAVSSVFDCEAGIRKNFEEDAGTAVPVDADGFQTGVGQQLNVQMMSNGGGVPAMTLGNAFTGGDPLWDKEYTSIAKPGDPRESVAVWIKEKFTASAGENLDADHAGKIADRYLQVGKDYEIKINKSGKAKLLDKGDEAAYIFKCKDFAMRVFRMYYGIDKFNDEIII